MASDSPLKRFLARTLTSLAAIAAVSAIFGVKAYEIDQRREAAAPAMAMAPPAAPADSAH